MKWNKIKDSQIQDNASHREIYELIEEPETGVSGREAAYFPLPSRNLPRIIWLGGGGRWLAEA